jgi:FAD/FMN-containing dehydrogenase
MTLSDTTTSRRLAELLADRLDGALLTAGDAGWDEARAAWQAATVQEPLAVALPAGPDDVVRTVEACGELGLRVTAQTTGHNAAPLGDLADTVLLRTGGLRELTVEHGLARVGAGVTWGEVQDAAEAAGLSGLTGTARGVGVVGYTLGGGVSWFGRAHGLAANHVVAVEIVTADGRLRRIDAEHDPDLFWAVRGGGGGFGVVTALEFRLFPITRAYAGALFWPIERAEDVLGAWRDLLPALPDEITSLGRLLRFPPVPDIPEPMRGRSLVSVELVSLLDAQATDALLAPLRALGPETDTVAECPVRALTDLHMDPPGPTPAAGTAPRSRSSARRRSRPSSPPSGRTATPPC